MSFAQIEIMIDPEIKFVVPFYLDILHSNYLWKHEDGSFFVPEVQTTLSQIDTNAISQLLKTWNWRPRLAASWFCGLKGYDNFEEKIGQLLLKSDLCFAGQGYCFALACFANERSVFHLENYLNFYLPQLDLYYDQNWAMSALIWIDEQNGSHYAKKYVEPNGLWWHFVSNKQDGWNLNQSVKHFRKTMTFCREHFAQ